MSSQVLFTGLLTYAVLLFSLSFHEFGHAWTALRSGDPTARDLGRVTLSPLAHADVVGTVLLPLVLVFTGGFLIGWAKPVPVNPANLRNPRRDHLLVSAAGPAANVVLAFVAAIVMRLTSSFLGPASMQGAFLHEILRSMMLINILLAVFNLIPLPPLDGSWVLYHVLPRDMAERYRIFGARWGVAVLVLLLVSGATWTWIRAGSALILPLLNAIAGTRIHL
ncbi:MAG: site-2 protease family protein [Candidatus Krumholzibacteriia bacterium]